MTAIEIDKKHLESLESKIDMGLSEEAAKMSLIFPFLTALGYNVFDTNTVYPEYVADYGKSKRWKVDLAILKEGKPVVFIEVKKPSESLVGVESQLSRYFSSCDVKIGIVTNGIEYLFFSDLEKKNVLDKSPYFVFDIRNITDKTLKTLSGYTPDKLDIESLQEEMERLKAIYLISSLLFENYESPSDNFVKYFLHEFSVSATAKHIDLYKSWIKVAFSSFLTEKISERFKQINVDSGEEEETDSESSSKSVVTEEEMEGFYAIRAILSEYTSSENITYRKTISYFNVTLRGKAHKIIMRLYFNNSAKKTISFLVNTEKHPIDTISDLYKYKKEIGEAFLHLEEQEK